MHYYQHHIGDFIRDTSNLTHEQLAVYMKMLWRYYDTEKPLDDDCEGIAFAVRSDEKTVQVLLRHFFKLQEDGWHHTRCDREIAAYHEKSEKAKNSANARWTNANALPTHTERNANEPVFDANQEPITNNQKPIREEAPRKRSASPQRPSDVGEQVWSDWLALRKAKRAPVTETVLASAMSEAEKAQLSLDAFLKVWCARGSQGLEAAWLKPDERGMAKPSEPFLKYQSTEYFDYHRTQRWWADAGFETVEEATMAGCHHKNFSEFRNGRKAA